MSAKILIADDESDIVCMLGSFFESKGFRVLPAFNGAEALKQVEKQPDSQEIEKSKEAVKGRDERSAPLTASSVFAVW